MLYYILENDTPLFFELFGGQLLKIPSKNEFLKAENSVRLFLYTVAHLKKQDPFIYTSYKFGIYMDRVYANFIDNYNIFIKNKPDNEIDLDVTIDDLERLEEMYYSAKESLDKIKKDATLNKRYTRGSSSKRKSDSDNDNVEIPNSAILQDEVSNEDAYSYLETEFDYNIDDIEDLSTSNKDDKDDSKQLSLF